MDGRIADLADRVRRVGDASADRTLETVIGEARGQIIAVGLAKVLQVVDPLDDLFDDPARIENG